MELIVVSGPDEGKRLELTGSVRSIGRKPENDLSLTDPNVSGRHALIRSVPTGDVELTDLSSTNGTRSNQSRQRASALAQEVEKGCVPDCWSSVLRIVIEIAQSSSAWTMYSTV